jgi:hypothetical protein
MKWWLISDDDINKIRIEIKRGIEEIDDNCARTGCICDLAGQCLCSRGLRDALHYLDTGLYIADCIPADYKEVDNNKRI